MATLPAVTGQIDNVTNSVIPLDLGQWGNLTVANNFSWGELTSWISQPANPMVWLSDSIDLGKETYFTLKITTEAIGNVGYTVYTSNVASFEDSYTTAVTVNQGDTAIPAFYGRHLTVAANVSNTGGIHSLQSMELEAATNRFDILLSDIDSTTLSGNINQKALPLGRTVSKVLNIQMTPYLTISGGAYVEATYIDSDYFLETLVTGVFPQIVDKLGTGANVAFIDNEGNYTDCVFDAQVYVYPEQFMDGINLTVR